MSTTPSSDSQIALRIQHGGEHNAHPRHAAVVLRPPQYNASTVATRPQIVVMVMVVALPLLLLPILGARIVVTAVLAAVTLLYLVDLAFNAWVVTGIARRRRQDIRVEQTEHDWPLYTVLCPIYREAAVLPQFVRAMTDLDYPTDRLQIILLLEEDDLETIGAARRLRLPQHFETLVVPDSLPKTKPKACNEGLRRARGEFTVIFDTEDIPEPDQLKKAVRRFRASRGDVACLQAPLNFYNPRQNTLTRLFTAEYTLWFDLLLEGLQDLRGPLPLGGTSNHFRTNVLIGLGGWDPYNVTEDCDLGIRLYKQGFRTGMLRSTTYEEANPNLRNWIRQRSRWIKGYMQTFLVHSRGGWRRSDPHILTFSLVVGGKVLVNFINPIMWAVTLLYFVARSVVGPVIESVYPPPLFYTALITLLLGNGLFVYTFLLGSAQRGNWDLVKYGLLAPVYWLAMSIAAVKAAWQLITRPFYWEKTHHGLHLSTSTAEPVAQVVRQALIEDQAP
ncbi:glycosyltransferase family 2 protein [Amnibacterium endophyticum]|uniref:Glycosyltransferase family 2 protein n=1 Tax=Amnibacterium endophyticum TaxID=2109337 RepID=A0ABW4L9D7_9MICO